MAGVLNGSEAKVLSFLNGIDPSRLVWGQEQGSELLHYVGGATIPVGKLTFRTVDILHPEFGRVQVRSMDDGSDIRLTVNLTVQGQQITAKRRSLGPSQMAWYIESEAPSTWANMT